MGDVEVSASDHRLFLVQLLQVGPDPKEENVCYRKTVCDGRQCFPKVKDKSVKVCFIRLLFFVILDVTMEEDQP